MPCFCWFVPIDYKPYRAEEALITLSSTRFDSWPSRNSNGFSSTELDVVDRLHFFAGGTQTSMVWSTLRRLSGIISTISAVMLINLGNIDNFSQEWWESNPGQLG